MNTIFDPTIRTAFTQRTQLLNPACQAAWGKMNVYQMTRHLVIWHEWVLGTHTPHYKQEFIGKIFGRMALKRLIKDEKPLSKNIPTSSYFKAKEENGDLEVQKQRLITLIDQYADYANPSFIHDFFGKMTKEETGILVYKHVDHHLRQFGV